MGRPKLLLPWNGGTVLDAVLGAWRASQVTRTILVAGELSSDYRSIADRHEAITIRPTPEPGEMIASIRAAIEWCEENLSPQSDDAWLVAPADLPRISTRLIDQLIAFHDSHPTAVVRPVSGGERGHPVLFPWAAARMVLELPGGATLRDLVARFPIEQLTWDDPSVWQDIDTPESYERLRDNMDGSKS